MNFSSRVFRTTQLSYTSNKIPSHFGSGSPAKKGIGYRWHGNNGDYVRIDKGSKLSDNPSQKIDHVRIQYNGTTIGKHGKPIMPGQDGVSNPVNHPDAHIPLQSWKNWKKWNEP